MGGPIVRPRRNDEQETEKANFLVVQIIRDAILDETFKPTRIKPKSSSKYAEVGLGAWDHCLKK
jgi:hypothetical protein